ncbi:MAG: dihydrofolate reductase [Hyphomicrobiaceae bacterium]
MARIVLVVAVSRNGVIGRAGGLPWKLSSDLKLFRRLTMGKPVIMGRKTWESVGKPLDGRLNIVVTRGPAIPTDGVVTARSLDEALTVARQRADADGADEIAVIGGGEIYRQALPLAQRIYLTEVDVTVDGDTIFPPLDQALWLETHRESFAQGPRDSAAFVLRVLDRAPAAGQRT